MYTIYNAQFGLVTNWSPKPLFVAQYYILSKQWERSRPLAKG